MDDSGYFSIQVISSALEVWGLELVPYSSADERVREALADPTRMQAFICNYRDHWLTIRRLGNQWFNLNSLLARPQLISDTYLSLFLAQLRNDGYSIFVIFGQLPECDADQLLRIRPAEPVQSNESVRVAKTQVSNSSEEGDMELQNALMLSLQENEVLREDQWNSQDDLERALRMSLQNEVASDDDDERQLRQAIDMSLECVSRTPSAPSTPCDHEEIRNRRLAFLSRTHNL